MKVQDFRVGNYVKSVLDDSIYEIDLWSLRVIQDGNYQNSYHPDVKVFEPIPLTRELLLKVGFDQCGYEFLFWEHDKIKGFQLAGINWVDEDIPEYQFLNYEVGTKIFSIHYLHQLQNLYFVLTGEELTFEHKESEF
jgi:hypothetical protein